MPSSGAGGGTGRSWYSFHMSGFGMCGQCIKWCRWWNWQRGQASTLSTLSGRKTMDISRINGSINDLHENGLLRLLVPVGGRATPPADISSPNYFVEVPSWSHWPGRNDFMVNHPIHQVVLVVELVKVKPAFFPPCLAERQQNSPGLRGLPSVNYPDTQGRFSDT